jgi:hypothetical protein
MSDLKNIRKFEYRPCRIATGFKIDFILEEETIHGLCLGVSVTGIRAALDGPVAVGRSGLLVLRHPTGELEIESRVAYSEKIHVGLIFLFRSSWESEMTSDYIASIANHVAASQIIQFP